MRMLHLRHGSGPAARAAGAAGEITGLLAVAGRAALDRLALWHERARQRRQLRELTDALLHDLGLTRSDADAEAIKPFWRP